MAPQSSCRRARLGRLRQCAGSPARLAGDSDVAGCVEGSVEDTGWLGGRQRPRGRRMEEFAKGLDMRADRCVWEEFQVFWGVWPPANKRRDATKCAIRRQRC